MNGAQEENVKTGYSAIPYLWKLLDSLPGLLYCRKKRFQAMKLLLRKILLLELILDRNNTENHFFLLLAFFELTTNLQKPHCWGLVLLRGF
eukprot:snap_masked-scaffold_2-processed-gene-27.28-mRNA-1 protein AED:1.00 eAED:1.00 QI:0/0/0/0/1/1/2/0/90